MFAPAKASFTLENFAAKILANVNVTVLALAP
jgi:hypothetical protein